LYDAFRIASEDRPKLQAMKDRIEGMGRGESA
jgi:hypothetical protein